MNKFSLIGLAFLLACSSKQPKQEEISVPPVRSFATVKSEPLQSYFSEMVKPTDPGFAVLVQADDSVLFKNGFGLANLKTQEAVTTQTLFNLGSISKTFVANGILILRERKSLSVEDNMAKYFPEFQNKGIANQVQLKHLLTHTSGLPDIRFPYQDSVFFLTAKDAENWAPIMKTQKLNFQPGEKFEYSNPAFNGLALIIESVSKTKWQSFIEAEIFKPSGMLTSTITDGAHPQSGVAHGYIKSAGQWLEKDYMEEPTFAASGNGGVWSSVDELALYHKALLSGTFLPKEVIAESFQVKQFSNWKDALPEKIGWSWFVEKTNDGLTTIGHTGSQGGFRANYVFVPEHNWLILILSTTPLPLEQYTNRVLDYLQTGN